MAQSRKHFKNNRKKTNVIIWGVVLVILLVFVILTTAKCHEDTKGKVQESLYPRGYSEYVNEAAAKYQLNPALIYAVIRTESNFNPEAVSHAPAYGLMQITEETFHYMMNMRGESNDYSTDDLFDPQINIDYGCYLLRYNLDYYNGNERSAVAAYNAGWGAVDGWLKDPDVSDDGVNLNPDYIPIEETRNYVFRVEEAKKKYLELYY